MRTSLCLLLCLLTFDCQRTETATPAAGKPNVTTTTVGDPTDARNMRVDSVIQPAPVFFETAYLGTQADASGNATLDEKAVPKGSQVFFTMRLKESPVGLATRAIWLDAKKKEIRKEERDMKGAKVVTFKLDTKPLSVGKYTAQGYWGGNLAVEKEFEIAPAAPKKAPAKKTK